MKSLIKVLLPAIVMGAAFTAAHAQPGAGDKTQSTVDGKASTQSGQKMDPGTVGGMNNAVGDKATSAQDVQRQTEGKPTMAQDGKDGKSAQGAKPGMTQHSPGTVGASPGTTAPMSNEKKVN